jgi:hypothetical protein
MLVNISMEHLGMVFGEGINLQISMVLSSRTLLLHYQVVGKLKVLAPTGSFHAK